jgi:TIR domain
LETLAAEVFVSYRTTDDLPPPDCAKEGFVRYLSKQIRWELGQLGVPNALLWVDRAKIAPGDDFCEDIRIALSNADLYLTILSRNYIQSSWCADELSTMASRSASESSGIRRIFRVDKHSVPDDQIPEPLRRIQSVRFYAVNEETKRDDEYYWRGEVRRKDEYMEAVHQLAQGIYDRLVQLGIPLHPPAPLADNKLFPTNGRTIFVAKPAGDVVEEYRALVRELRRTGYRVTPDADKDLPKDGEEVRAVIAKALAEAEASIHLLGERTGGRPDGLDVDLVPLQLASAALEFQRRPKFQRLIWAPKVPPRRASSDTEVQPRDPMSVLDRFDHRLATDQIDGDTASRFNEFVLQRLEFKPGAAAAEANTVYIRCGCDDRSFGLSVARELKRLGLAPLLSPAPSEGSAEDLAQAEQKMVSRAQHVIVCWGPQNRTQMLAEVTNPILQKWRATRRREAKLILLVTSPMSEPKAEVTEFGIGPDVDCVIDASRGENLTAIVETHLVPALE